MQDVDYLHNNDPFLNNPSEHSSFSTNSLALNHSNSNQNQQPNQHHHNHRRQLSHHSYHSTSSSTGTDFFSKQPPVCQSLVCVICHEVFKSASSLKCGHSFCYNCIREYFLQRERSCPICRRQYSTSFSLSPNLVAQQVISELEEYYRKSKEEKRDMEMMRQFVLSANQTLQNTLEMQETSLEESKRLFNKLEIEISQELSKVEAQLQDALDVKREVEEANEVLRATIQQLQAAQEESQSSCAVLEITLREEIQNRYNQTSQFQQEKRRLFQEIQQLNDEIALLRKASPNAPGADVFRNSPQNNNLKSSSCKLLRQEFNVGLSDTCSRDIDRKTADTLVLCKGQPIKGRFLSRVIPNAASRSSILELGQSQHLLQFVLKLIWTAVVLGLHVLSEFPVFLDRGLGRFMGTEIPAASSAAATSVDHHRHHPPPATTKVIQKVLNVLYAIWLLWILYSVGTAATIR